MTERFQPFHESQERIWKQFAEAVGADIVEDRTTWGGDEVRAHVGDWTVILDTHAAVAGYTTVTLTRIRAAFFNEDGFRFRVAHRDIFSDIAGLFGAQDIAVGDADFDREFVITTNDEAKARALFSDSQLQKLLRENASAQMMVKPLDEKDDEPDRDELYLEIVGVVHDVPRLLSLYRLFAETLNRLCHLGVDYEDDPRIAS